MKKWCTGPMQITPYRPWSEERKAAARARHGVRKNLGGRPVAYVITRLKDEIRKYGQKPADYSSMNQPKQEAWFYAVDAELARQGASITDPTPLQLANACQQAMERHSPWQLSR